MIVVVFIAIAVGCRHCYRNGRQQRDNNQLTSNDNGDGRRDGDATVTAIEGATEMQRGQWQWQWQWMAGQSNGGGSDGRHNDCNGRLATVAMDRDSATAAQQRWRWKA